MSEAALSSSPTKSLSSWWRNFKSGSRESDHDPNSLAVPGAGPPRRPGLSRSSASSSAVPGLPPSKVAPHGRSVFEMGVPPQYGESPIFGVPLNVSLRYANVKISLADRSGDQFVYGHVPIIIAKCAVYLKQNARETEGIFRIPGSVRRVRMLQELFNTPPKFGKDLDWNGFSVHDAANLLKRYLAMLPDPIIPRHKYALFREPLQTQFLEIRDYMNYYSVTSTQGSAASAAAASAAAAGPLTPLRTPPVKPSHEQVEAAVTIYENLIFALPKSSQQLLLYLIDLLSVFAARSEANRMTAYNLAAIFQPSVLTIKEHDMNPDESQTSRIVLEFLVENSVALLKRVQEKAVTTYELRKDNPEDSSIEQGVKDYTPVEEHEFVPPFTVSAPGAGGDDEAAFVQGHARRHSKSLSSANPPALLPEPVPAPKLGFLRRQKSSRSRTSSTSRSPSEEHPNLLEANEDEHSQLRHSTRSPPAGDEERKSRFRRSLMVLYPGKDS